MAMIRGYQHLNECMEWGKLKTILQSIFTMIYKCILIYVCSGLIHSKFRETRITIKRSFQFLAQTYVTNLLLSYLETEIHAATVDCEFIDRNHHNHCGIVITSYTGNRDCRPFW